MEARTPMSQDRIEAAQAAGQERIIRTGISGVTSISILRRVHDARFAARYFRGDGIDVGGGIDSIALYQELFPGIRHCFVYDQQHGDAQLLANVADSSFDFLSSSHCLEHLRDPAEALRNWLRVVKPGGYLVVEVPDEDLYEQGHWPSRFNGDHKLTFTIAKARSWSPVSVNLVDLLRPFAADAQLLSLQLLDQGFRYGLAGRNFDQTRTPSAECGIEFVMRRLPR
jgi:SAM-dependent methyltransferase